MAADKIGVNYEFAPWVIGIEGSGTSSNISGSTVNPALWLVAAQENTATNVQ